MGDQSSLTEYEGRLSKIHCHSGEKFFRLKQFSKALRNRAQGLTGNPTEIISSTCCHNKLIRFLLLFQFTKQVLAEVYFPQPVIRQIMSCQLTYRPREQRITGLYEESPCFVSWTIKMARPRNVLNNIGLFLVEFGLLSQSKRTPIGQACARCFLASYAQFDFFLMQSKTDQTSFIVFLHSRSLEKALISCADIILQHSYFNSLLAFLRDTWLLSSLDYYFSLKKTGSHILPHHLPPQSSSLNTTKYLSNHTCFCYLSCGTY